jgi:hypothetical protein
LLPKFNILIGGGINPRADLNLGNPSLSVNFSNLMSIFTNLIDQLIGSFKMDFGKLKFIFQKLNFKD